MLSKLRHLNVQTVLVGLAVSMSVLFAVIYFDIDASRTNVFTTFLITVAAVQAALSFFRYLSPTDETSPKTSAERLAELENTVLGLKEDHQRVRDDLLTVAAPFNEEDRAELKNRIGVAMINEVFMEKLSEAATRLASHMTKADIVGTADKNAVVTLARLNSAIPDSLRRANINLFIGILAAAAGIAVLAFGVFSAPPAVIAKEDVIFSYARYFLPRLSLGILIEVFAYFFLSLYKTNLDGVRYLQNEMTNVEMARLGLVTALLTEDKASVATIVGQMGKTDRNTAAASATASPVSRKEVETALELLRAAVGVKGKE